MKVAIFHDSIEPVGGAERLVLTSPTASGRTSSRQILIGPSPYRRLPMGGQAYVVILNWNGRDLIRDCLRAALQQTYEPYRVLVVDNGSPDRSGEIVATEFPEATLVRLPENLQFARGTNVGVRRALADPACEFVVTLNNDTRADPEWLAALVRHAGDGVGMVASKLLMMDRPRVLNSTGLSIAVDGSGQDRGWNEVDMGQYDGSGDVFGPSAGAALYRREMLESTDLFDEEFVAYYEDLDLAWRARLSGWEARFAPDAIVYHKVSASHGRGSPLKTYLCERNRIWNLVQNYPWRYAALGLPWNSARILARPVPWTDARDGVSDRVRPPLRGNARAMARARLDAYGGLRRALSKRRLREHRSRVDAATVGNWFRKYHVSFRASVLA